MRIIIEMTEAESRQATLRQEPGGQLATGSPVGTAGSSASGGVLERTTAEAAAGTAATPAIDAGPPPSALLLAVEGEPQDTVEGDTNGRGDTADGANGGEPAAWLIDSLAMHVPQRFG